VGGGAWPFLVGGVICLVNSVNERDLSLLISAANRYTYGGARWLSGRASAFLGCGLASGAVPIRQLTS
jgi:hypothetical protein